MTALSFKRLVLPLMRGKLNSAAASELLESMVGLDDPKRRPVPFRMALAWHSVSPSGSDAVEVLNALVAAGVQFDKRIEYERATREFRSKTLLHFAVESGSAELVAQLLAIGANPDERIHNISAAGKRSISRSAIEVALVATPGIQDVMRSWLARQRIDGLLAAAAPGP